MDSDQTAAAQGLRTTHDLFIEVPGEALATQTYMGAIARGAQNAQKLTDIEAARRREIMGDPGLNGQGRGARLHDASKAATQVFIEAVKDSQAVQLEERCRAEMDELLRPQKALALPADKHSFDQRAVEEDARAQLRGMSQVHRDRIVRAAAQDGQIATLRAALLVEPAFRLVSEEVEREVLEVFVQRTYPDAYRRNSEGLAAAYVMKGNLRRLADRLNRIYQTQDFTAVRTEMGL